MADKRQSSYSRVRKYRCLDKTVDEIVTPELELTTEICEVGSADADAAGIHPSVPRVRESLIDISGSDAILHDQEPQVLPRENSSVDESIVDCLEAQSYRVEDKNVENISITQTMPQKIRN